jgi:hypothetical protein
MIFKPGNLYCYHITGEINNFVIPFEESYYVGHNSGSSLLPGRSVLKNGTCLMFVREHAFDQHHIDPIFLWNGRLVFFLFMASERYAMVLNEMQEK